FFNLFFYKHANPPGLNIQHQHIATNPVRGRMFVAQQRRRGKRPRQGSYVYSQHSHIATDSVRSHMFIANHRHTVTDPVRGRMFVAQQR
ncbi:MAG: hypothetical protein JXK95_11905, partial [Bacteroidales bacterium]|nr:hypothetical protein [Bacteroidales bacterium]